MKNIKISKIKIILLMLILIILLLSSFIIYRQYSKEKNINVSEKSSDNKISKENKLKSDTKQLKINYNNVDVDIVVDQPELKEVDAIILFHGTVLYDENSIKASKKSLNEFKSILDKKDFLLISVAYPFENIMFGDSISQAEASLLWVQNKANEELGVNIKKVFLAGHSQGGYLVTRLNTMYKTDGVIASAPGPLNLVFRCNLEEKNKIDNSPVCDKLRDKYGSTDKNPEAYFQRSLLNFTNDFKSDILFVQGLDDSPIHIKSWPEFKEKLSLCKDCKDIKFTEIENGTHTALFDSQIAKKEFNNFIQSKR